MVKSYTDTSKESSNNMPAKKVKAKKPNKGKILFVEDDKFLSEMAEALEIEYSTPINVEKVKKGVG